MKKIYLLITVVGMALNTNAQLSLTQAANEPVPGNFINNTRFDSVGVVPKSTGINQTWSFLSFAQTTVTSATSYSLPSAVSEGTNFPTATYVEIRQNGDWAFYESSTTPTTQTEFLGLADNNGTVINYTNTLISAIWPVTYGSVISDVGSGTVTISNLAGTVDGTLHAEGTGTGTLILPGNVSLSNMLQVTSTTTTHIEAGSGLSSFTLNARSKTYSYYHSTAKFPIINVEYTNNTISTILGPTVTASARIFINNVVITGLNDKNFDASFQIFPNPAKDYFDINLSNAHLANCTIEIYNSVGQLVNQMNLGNQAVVKTRIDLNEFEPGVYMVKTKLGDKLSTRKLIVQ